jgi:hypothetical protein
VFLRGLVLCDVGHIRRVQILIGPRVLLPDSFSSCIARALCASGIPSWGCPSHTIKIFKWNHKDLLINGSGNWSVVSGIPGIGRPPIIVCEAIGLACVRIVVN